MDRPAVKGSRESRQSPTLEGRVQFPGTAQLAPCDRRTADYAVRNWHYHGHLPAGKLVTFAAWEDAQLVGSIVYCRGASPYLFEAYGLTQYDGCELGRVAFTTHERTTGSYLAESLHELRRLNPDLQLVVSFADENQGHIGVLYQATNWLYLGHGKSDLGYIIHGKPLHTRTVGALYPSTSIEWLRENVDPNTRRNPPPLPKHRYVYPLTKRLRRRLEPNGLSYPKPS